LASRSTSSPSGGGAGYRGRGPVDDAIVVNLRRCRSTWRKGCKLVRRKRPPWAMLIGALVATAPGADGVFGCRGLLPRWESASSQAFRLPRSPSPRLRFRVQLRSNLFAHALTELKSWRVANPSPPKGRSGWRFGWIVRLAFGRFNGVGGWTYILAVVVGVIAGANLLRIFRVFNRFLTRLQASYGQCSFRLALLRRITDPHEPCCWDVLTVLAFPTCPTAFNPKRGTRAMALALPVCRTVLPQAKRESHLCLKISKLINEGGGHHQASPHTVGLWVNGIKP